MNFLKNDIIDLRFMEGKMLLYDEKIYEYIDLCVCCFVNGRL